MGVSSWTSSHVFLSFCGSVGVACPPSFFVDRSDCCFVFLVAFLEGLPQFVDGRVVHGRACLTSATIVKDELPFFFLHLSSRRGNY